MEFSVVTETGHPMTPRQLRVNAIRDKLEQWFPDSEIIHIRIRGDQKFRVIDSGGVYILQVSKELIDALRHEEMAQKLEIWDVADYLRSDGSVMVTRSGPQRATTSGSSQ